MHLQRAVSRDKAKSSIRNWTGVSALEQACLVRGTNATAVVHGMLDLLRGSTPPQPVKHYELTDEIKKYFKQVPGTFGTSSGFCYGRKTVDSIVKCTEPMAIDADSQTEVTYTYKVVDPASWAGRSDVQRAYSDFQTTVTAASATTQIVSQQGLGGSRYIRELPFWPSNAASRISRESATRRPCDRRHLRSLCFRKMERGHLARGRLLC
jgi:hypothetical protein